jgi:ABC-2 type transport system permease protein
VTQTPVEQNFSSAEYRMLKGLWNLTWLETKIFVREPLGVMGTVGVPVLVFVIMGRLVGGRLKAVPSSLPTEMSLDVSVLAALLIATSAVLSLVTIISIYREGGILKRLRATPLRPQTILVAHVMVKLGFTALTLALMALLGRRYFPAGLQVPWASFTIALLLTTSSVMTMGFVIASIVPTARFAQPIATIVFYPMLGLSGLFVPVDGLPPVLQPVARMLPLRYAVSFLKGVLKGDAWAAHTGDLAALALVAVVSLAISSRVFRWE